MTLSRLQIYQLQARELMKKSMEKAGGETGTKNTKELCCKRKTAVHHAVKKNVVDTRRADRSRASCERQVAMKSSPSAQHNGSSVHAEQKRGQSCGCAGACVCVNVTMCMRESVNTTNMMCVHAHACIHLHTQKPAECVPVKKQEQKKDNRARAWAQV